MIPSQIKACRSFRALYGTNHVSHTFSGRDIGEIKFTTPFTIPLEKKVVASALLHFVNKLHAFRG